jgi:hypothetical protein
MDGVLTSVGERHCVVEGERLLDVVGLVSRLWHPLPMLENLVEEPLRLLVFVVGTHPTKGRTQAARMSA